MKAKQKIRGPDVRQEIVNLLTYQSMETKDIEQILTSDFLLFKNSVRCALEKLVKQGIIIHRGKLGDTRKRIYFLK